MAMVFCRGCAKEIHETAPLCPQCGATQQTVVPALTLASATQRAGSPWLAILSLVLGLICVLALFDDSEWDKETILGLGLFSVAGLVCGITSINKKSAGHNMAIAGVILCAIATLIFVGLSIN